MSMQGPCSSATQRFKSTTSMGARRVTEARRGTCPLEFGKDDVICWLMLLCYETPFGARNKHSSI